MAVVDDDPADPDRSSIGGFGADGLADRAGFDPGFLGVEVPLPQPASSAVVAVLLPYTHFSVLLRPDRRLAAVTGVGIDGDQLIDLPRAGITWRPDPRLAAGQQTGADLYDRNDLDRGHLVRRRDPVWGTRAQAMRANTDTFHFPNAAPQAAGFNQGKELWAGLENYLLDHAATYDRKLVVFTGPVLAATDPPYRGIQIPLRFFKVAVFLDASGPAATGYLLDQAPLVDDLPGVLAQAAAAGDPPPLGPFRSYQVPIADLATLTDLQLDQLAALDRLPARPPARSADPRPSRLTSRWRRLRTPTDIVWDR